MRDKGKTHETTFNVSLAEALKCQRPAWRNQENTIVEAERTDIVRKKQPSETTRGTGLHPDVFLEAPDLCPVIVEVEFDDSNSPPEDDARKRLGLISKSAKEVRTVVAVKAPKELRKKTHQEITDFLKEGGVLQYACLHQSEEQSRTLSEDAFAFVRWPEDGYLEGTVSDLTEVIVQSASITGQLEDLAREVSEKVKYIGETLLDNLPPETIRLIKERLGQRDDKQGMYVVVCVWLNALIFHERIACDRKDGTIPLLASIINSPNQKSLQKELNDAWEKILQINYHSIFEPAKDCLKEGFPLGIFKNTLIGLVKLVERISENRISALVDVSASIFPLLSDDRKTTAAFYTKPEVAELLAGLCLSSPLKKNATNTRLATFSQQCWSNSEKLQDLRVLDPACGTGTLLRAAYRRIRSLHEQQGGNTADLHDGFMSRVLHGIDIKPIAVHLTAASLSGVESARPYQKTNVVMAKVGRNKTGALELIKKDELIDLFASDVQASYGKKTEGRGERFSIPSESQDLVIMNPPYSRTRGGQRAFDVDGQEEKERLESQKRAQYLLKNTPANMKAGMGTAFMVLADKKLKPGGILGSVLPLTAAAQRSWAGIRKMLGEHYEDIVVVATVSDRQVHKQADKQESFSADTGMGEMLLVARKKSDKGNNKKTQRLTVNMERLPLHLADAMEIAKAINGLRDKEQTEGMLMLAGHTRIGQWVRTSFTSSSDPWGEVGAKDRGLSIAINGLQEGYLTCRDGGKKIKLPLEITSLGNLFSVGPTHHLIGHRFGCSPIGAFEFHEIKPTEVPINPSLWAADAQRQRQLIVRSTHEGVEQDARLAKKMREKRSTLFIARNMRWTSQALLVAMTEKKALGGRAWTALLQKEPVKQAFVFWANSTLGMLLYWMHGGRQQLGRSVIQVKALADIPTPNFAADSEQGLRARDVAERYFSSFQHGLKAACLAWQDEARQKIDQIVCEMLDLEAHSDIIDDLRKSWCFEPSVHGGKKEAIKLIYNENT